MQAVLGSSVASNKNLKVGDKFFGTHGFDDHGHIHDNHAYVVVGILKQSYSVADNLILTNLKSVWQVHEEHDDCEDDHSHDHSNHDHSHDHHSHDHSNHTVMTIILMTIAITITVITIILMTIAITITVMTITLMIIAITIIVMTITLMMIPIK